MAIAQISVEKFHVARNGAGWCGVTHGRTVWYMDVRDGIVWDGAESRDMGL